MRTAIVAAARTAGRALRRQPEALFLVGLLELSGLVYFFGNPPPNPVQALIPPAVVTLWYAQLTLGAALRLAGLLAEQPRLSLAGAVFLATASLVYATAIAAVDGHGSLLAALVTYALSATYVLLVVAYLGDARRGRGEGPEL